MPKVKSWGLNDASEPDDLQAFEPYDGDNPPRGVYKFRLTNFRVKANRNDDPMLNGLLIVQEDRKGKSKFNGFPVWFNQNVTDQGKPYVKQFLKALGLNWNDLMNKTVVEGSWPESNEDDPAPIAKIGTLKFSGDDVMVRASIRPRKDNDEEMEVGSFLPWKDDEEDESDDIEDEESEDEDEEEEEEEDEEDEDEEEEEEEDEDEDEPAPARKRAAAKKGAAKKTTAKRGSPF